MNPALLLIRDPALVRLSRFSESGHGLDLIAGRDDLQLVPLAALRYPMRLSDKFIVFAFVRSQGEHRGKIIATGRGILKTADGNEGAAHPASQGRRVGAHLHRCHLLTDVAKELTTEMDVVVVSSIAYQIIDVRVAVYRNEFAVKCGKNPCSVTNGPGSLYASRHELRQTP